MILITFIYNFRFRIDVLLQGACVFYIVLVFVYPSVQSIAHFVEQKQHYAFRSLAMTSDISLEFEKWY